MAMQFLEVKPLTSHDDDLLPATTIAAAAADARYGFRRSDAMVMVMGNEWWMVDYVYALLAGDG